MRLNNKGYLIVEVILAGFLTFTMAYFLINLTLKVRNKMADVNVETILLNDKTVVTNEIMTDIINNKITNVINTTDGVSIIYSSGETKNLVLDDNTIYYGSYIKTLNENAIIGSMNIDINDDYFLVEIPIFTKYSNKDYGINIFGFIEGAQDE